MYLGQKKILYPKVGFLLLATHLFLLLSDKIIASQWIMRVLAFSSLVTAALGDAVTFTPANIMNKYDFLKAEITSMDYTRQICPKSNVGSLPECLKCYEENTCSMSMVGFESRVARHNPADPVDLTGPTTVLMASFIGAPTFIVRLHSFFFPFFLCLQRCPLNRVLMDRGFKSLP